MVDNKFDKGKRNVTFTHSVPKYVNGHNNRATHLIEIFITLAVNSTFYLYC